MNQEPFILNEVKFSELDKKIQADIENIKLNNLLNKSKDQIFIEISKPCLEILMLLIFFGSNSENKKIKSQWGKLSKDTKDELSKPFQKPYKQGTSISCHVRKLIGPLKYLSKIIQNNCKEFQNISKKVFEIYKNDIQAINSNGDYLQGSGKVKNHHQTQTFCIIQKSENYLLCFFSQKQQQQNKLRDKIQLQKNIKQEKKQKKIKEPQTKEQLLNVLKILQKDQNHDIDQNSKTCKLLFFITVVIALIIMGILWFQKKYTKDSWPSLLILLDQQLISIGQVILKNLSSK